MSFAEYNSKRNFVEHIQADENKCLQKHAIFGDLKSSTPETTEHREEMACFVKEVSDALKDASFGGAPILCYEGVSDEQFIFEDDRILRNFLKMSEERKLMSPHKYAAKANSITQTLVLAYGGKSEFTSMYSADYAVMSNLSL